MTRTFPTKPLFLLLCLSLAACTSELADGNPAGGEGAIAFQVPQTRAAVTSAADMQAFSVWGGYDGNATNVFDGKEVAKGGGGTVWTYQGTQYWLAGKTYNFYAVYPVGVGSCDAQGNITVSDFDASQDNYGRDLMTADVLNIAYAESETPAPVAFTFQHELARVNIIVRTDPSVSVSDLIANLKGVRPQGTLARPAGGRASWTLGQKSVELAEEVSSMTDNSEKTLWDLMLIPQETQGIELSISLKRAQDGESDTETVKFYVDFSDTMARWSAGHSYRYLLTVEVDAITFGNFTVPQWDETHTGGDINIGASTNNQGN